MVSLAPHETLELHELLSAASTEIKKMRITVVNVKDNELKNYINSYLTFKKDNFEAIQKLVEELSKQV